MYVDLGGFWSIIALITFVLIMRKFYKLNKQSIAFAKDKFLQNSEAQAYIQDGFEIKNIIDEGNGIYKFELSKKN